MGRRFLKKIVAVFLTGCMLTGCGTVDDYVSNEGYLQEAENVKIDSTKAIAKDKIKVGVLYISDPNEGSGYSYTHDLGIIGMQQNLELKDSQIVRKVVADDATDLVDATLKECIDEGCNIIFTTSWGYMNKTAEYAEKYPNVYFSHGTGYLSNGKNFNNYFGRIYQARYLSGIVAGMNTKSNKIGYVAAMGTDNSEVTGGIDAFALGVEAVNPNATVYVEVTNSWYDAPKEEAASKKLLDFGCDVMTQHCDTAYPITLAKEYGVYAIGYNSDMSKEVSDTCLCSVIWNWSAYYTQAVQSVIKGTWDGSNYYGGMSDGVIHMTSVAPFANSATQMRVAEEEAKILKGTFNVFDGELKTNTGDTIGKAGSTLDDATITGKMNWYYRNVSLMD